MKEKVNNLLKLNLAEYIYLMSKKPCVRYITHVVNKRGMVISPKLIPFNTSEIIEKNNP